VRFRRRRRSTHWGVRGNRKDRRVGGERTWRRGCSQGNRVRRSGKASVEEGATMWRCLRGFAHGGGTCATKRREPIAGCASLPFCRESCVESERQKNFQTRERVNLLIILDDK